jgi:genome maintenance exonuclease 1
MFNHVDAPVLQDLPTVQTEDARMYKVSDGVFYPSVTSVIGATEDKTGLLEWKARVGEEQANRISVQAAMRGTAIHQMCEDYLNNKDPYKNQMPSNAFTFNQIKDILEDNVNNIYYQEAPLYSHYLKVAGRVDCVAEYQGKRSIIDFKTSRKPKRREWIKGYFMQTAAYAVMFEELTKIPVSRLVVIIAVDDSEPQVFVEKRDDHIGDFIQQRQKYKELYNV